MTILFDNAIKYTDDGVISVMATSTDRYLIFRVADNGLVSQRWRDRFLSGGWAPDPSERWRSGTFSSQQVSMLKGLLCQGQQTKGTVFEVKLLLKEQAFC